MHRDLDGPRNHLRFEAIISVVPPGKAQDYSTFVRKFLTCLIVPATHYEINHLIAVQGILVPHHAEGSQTPVYSVHSKVCCKVVYQVILVLRRT